MLTSRTFAPLALLAFASVAHADSISAGAVAPVTIGASADTLSLNSASATVAEPGLFTQSGVFKVGDSGSMNKTVAFSFVDNVTINGVTRAVTVNGSDQVTPGYDLLSIFPTGPISIGSASWSLRGFDLTAYQIQPYALTLTADVNRSITPEPAGLALLGSGAFATALVTRRRFYFG